MSKQRESGNGWGRRKEETKEGTWGQRSHEGKREEEERIKDRGKTRQRKSRRKVIRLLY